jgi:hypothetical protein
MTREDRACWVDTEGCIPTYIRSRGSLSSEITVVQSEKEPLRDYAAGAKADGVMCHVSRHQRAWRVRISGIRNVDREISLIGRFIRTSKRKREIRRFYRMVHSRWRARLEFERGRLFSGTPKGSSAPVV